MKTKSNWNSRIALVCALSGVALAAQPARAVTLEQKWLAGQQLNYDMTMNGTLTIDTDAGAPVLWAGLPLEVLLKGSGQVALDTRKVDENGAGLVALKLPSFKVTGSAWEQNVVLDILDGQPKFSFNGKDMTGPQDKRPNLQFLVEPTYGLQISRLGRVERAVPLVEEVEKKDNATTGANDAKNSPGAPINVAGLMRSAFFQMLPAPWPAHEVEIGDTWTIVSRLPIPAAKTDEDKTEAANADDAKTDEAAPAPAFQVLELGKFDMTLKGEETLDGKKALRVGVVGTLSLDAAKAKILNKAAGNKAGGNKVSSATQKISGDLWFDANAGQFVKAALVLKGQMKGVGGTPAKGAEKAKTWGSTQSFYGNIGLKLKNVTMANEVPKAP